MEDETRAMAPAGHPSPAAPEAGSLAREMSRAVAQMAAYYERTGLSTSEASAAARALAPDAEHVLETPPDQISWATLGQLAEHDPEKAQAAWERIEDEAFAELASGHRAAAAVERDGTPWARARFMAVLRGFVTDWQPRGSIETALLETLAQAYTAQLIWMTRLQVLTLAEAKRQDRDLERQGQWEPPTVDAAAAIDQAAAMVDRFNRLFARTLRALRDLGRYTPQIVVQKVDQLNVGAQQVNMAPQPPTSSVAEPDGAEREALQSSRPRKARQQRGGDAAASDRTAR